jgi:hypothetical protein
MKKVMVIFGSARAGSNTKSYVMSLFAYLQFLKMEYKGIFYRHFAILVGFSLWYSSQDFILPMYILR